MNTSEREPYERARNAKQFPRYADAFLNGDILILENVEKREMILRWTDTSVCLPDMRLVQHVLSHFARCPLEVQKFDICGDNGKGIQLVWPMS